MPGFRNDIFICYHRGSDLELARSLQRSLEGLACPWWRRRRLRVFLDDTDVEASEWGQLGILRELARSRFLLYLASPGACRSAWVERELREWFNRAEASPWLLALTEGSLGIAEAAGCTPNLPIVLPAILRERPCSPVWVDLVQLKATAEFSRENREWMHAIAKLGSVPLGMELREVLAEEDQVYQARQRAVRAAVVAMGALAAVATGSATLAWRASLRAEGEAQAARIAEVRAQEEAARSEDMARFAVANSLAEQRTTAAIQVIREVGDITLPGWAALAERLLRRPAVVHNAMFPGAGPYATHLGPHGELAFLVAGGSVALQPDRTNATRIQLPTDATNALFLQSGELTITSLDGAVRRWSPSEVRVLGSHGAPSRVLALTDGGRTLISGGDDGRLRLWNLNEGEGESGSVRLGAPVVWLAAAQRTRTIGAITAAGSAWVSSARGLVRLPRAGEPYGMIDVSPEGDQVVTTGPGETVDAWGDDGRLIRHVVPRDSRRIEETVVRMASTLQWTDPKGAPGTLYLFGGIYGANWVNTPGSRYTTFAAFRAGGELVVFDSIDQVPRVDIYSPTGAKVSSVLGSGPFQIGAVRLSPDGRWLAATQFRAAPRVWDLVRGREYPLLEETQVSSHARPSSPEAIEFGTDSRTLVTTNQRLRQTLLWSLDPLGVGREDGDSRPAGGCEAVSAGGWAARADDQTVILANLGASPSPIRTRTFEARVTAVAFDTSGDQLVVGTENGRVHVTNAWESERPQRELDAGQGPVRSVCLDASSQRLIVAKPDGYRAFQLGSDSKVLGESRRQGLRAAVHDSHFRWILEISTDGGDAYLSSLATPAPSPRVVPFETRVTEAAFAPDGEMIALGGTGKLGIWRDGTLTRLDQDPAGEGDSVGVIAGAVSALAWSPDGTRLATGSDRSEKLLLWDVATHAVRTLLGHEHSVISVAFDPTGALLASGGTDNTVRIWDIVSEEVLQVIDLRGPAMGLSFTADGRMLYVERIRGHIERVRLFWDDGHAAAFVVQCMTLPA